MPRPKREQRGVPAAVGHELVVLDVAYEGLAVDLWGGTRAGFTAAGQVNREDWGLSWNAVLDAGGFLVGKTVTIDLDVKAGQELTRSVGERRR